MVIPNGRLKVWHAISVLLLLGCCGALFWLELRQDGRLPDEYVRILIQKGMTEAEVDRVLGPADSVTHQESGRTTKLWHIVDGRVGEPPLRPSTLFASRARNTGLSVTFREGKVLGYVYGF